MDSELEYFRAREHEYFQASATASQQAPWAPRSGSLGMPYHSGTGGNGKYQDFSGWPSPFGDGESTGPASDDFDGSCQIASSSSDEDTERKAGQSKSLQRSSCDNGAAKKPSAPMEFLPVEGLVDIDSGEGRRRGDELWALLMPQAHEEAPKAPAAAAPSSILSVNAPEFTPPNPASVPTPQLRQTRPPQQQATSNSQWAAVWEGCGTGGWSSNDPEPAPANVSRHAAEVQQSAKDAFGAMLKEVVVASDGYLILLHESLRQYEDVPVLAILSRALWPLLGKEVVGLEPSPAPAGQPRLALQVRGDGSEQDSECCWQFATTGECPRGSRCRWEHRHLGIYTTYIDVVY